MRCLVTGAAGFIGSHLCQELVASGHTVRGLDNFRSGSRQNLNNLDLEFVEADIRDGTTVREALADIDAVFHMAAFISVPESVENPEECFDINVNGTETLLRACAETKVKHFVFSGSCAVYGDSPGFPKTEQSPTNPLSPYAESKLQGEELVEAYAGKHGFHGVSFRYFNVYGERQDPRSFYAAVIAKFTANALQGKPLVIFGDGSASRDFIYVKDIARANRFFMESTLSGLYQVGTGVESSVLEVAKTILELTDSPSVIDFQPERKGDLLRSCGDVSKLLSTGYKNRFSLREGLEAMLKASL